MKETFHSRKSHRIGALERLVLPLVLVCLLVLAGCGQNASSFDCPYTTLNWDTTAEELISVEGSNYETYDSMYKGLTYTYDKEYLGLNGTVKYMFDSGNKLVNVAWTYTSENDTDIQDSYLAVYNALCDIRGSESENADGVNTYGEIWRDEVKGNVVLSGVLTSDSKMIQCSFMSPEVSKAAK